QPLERADRHTAACPERMRVRVAIAAGIDDGLSVLLPQSLDETKSQTDGRAPLRSACDRLQGAIHGARVHVRMAHLHAVLARVAYELCGLVEAHRLAVDERRAEHVRVVPLDPGRHVGKLREARGMAFGKAIAAEAFDLLEAPLGKLASVAVTD